MSIRELMGSCVGKEVVTVLGDKAVLGPQLKAAKLL